MQGILPSLIRQRFENLRFSQRPHSYQRNDGATRLTPRQVSWDQRRASHAPVDNTRAPAAAGHELLLWQISNQRSGRGIPDRRLRARVLSLACDRNKCTAVWPLFPKQVNRVAVSRTANHGRGMQLSLIRSPALALQTEITIGEDPPTAVPCFANVHVPLRIYGAIKPRAVLNPRDVMGRRGYAGRSCPRLPDTEYGSENIDRSRQSDQGYAKTSPHRPLDRPFSECPGSCHKNLRFIRGRNLYFR